VEPVRSLRNITTRQTIIGIAILASVVVLVDLVVKRAVTSWLGPDAGRHAWWLVGDDIGFEYVRNSGAAFGMLRGNAEALAAVSILIAVGFTWLVIAEVPHRGWAVVAGGLLAGGAVGNLVERIADGFVTDYLAVGPWPRFNVADSAISIGVGVFLVALLVSPSAGEARGEARREPDATQGREARRDGRA
jgi:signal peptidase II